MTDKLISAIQEVMDIPDKDKVNLKGKFYTQVAQRVQSVRLNLGSEGRIRTEVVEYSEVDKLTFNAHVMKEILSANKDCESSMLEISSEGLAKMNFKIDEFDSTYFLVANQDS